MYYFKKIISYLDYYEFGEKKKSCGYSKIMVKDQEVTAEIHIKGVDKKASCVCDIYTAGEQKVRLGKFVLDKGTGCYHACFDGMDMDGSRLRIFDVTGFYIYIDENRHCETAWEWGKVPVQAQSDLPDPAENTVHKKLPEASHEEEFYDEEETEEIIIVEQTADEKEPEETVSEEEAVSEEETERADTEEKTVDDWNGLFLHKAQIPNTAVGKETSGIMQEGSCFQETLHEDKWEQLCSLYPVCHPFHDGEDYISIAPKDFIILRREYQNLVSNSFLLHSFYNYHHIILGKTGKDGMCYMGVPGSYLDREKRVAVMFGFEGFAQSARGNGSGNTADRAGRPVVAPGAFGYYMRKVEI